jgi:hypothetical protein
MARRIIDISVSLEAGIKFDPPIMEPEIEYQAHGETAASFANFFPV